MENSLYLGIKINVMKNRNLRWKLELIIGILIFICTTGTVIWYGPEKILNARNVGLLIGFAIVFTVIKFTWFGIIWAANILEDMFVPVFKDTRFEEPVGKFFRKLGNLVENFKWADPKENMWRAHDRTLNAIHSGDFTQELKAEIDKEETSMEDRDQLRTFIVGAIVFTAVILLHIYN